MTSAVDAQADPVPAPIRKILAIAREKRTPLETSQVFSYWRTTVPEWNGANSWINSLERKHPEGTSQLVLREREGPRTTHILERGDFLKPAKAVTPGVPAFLSGSRSLANPSRLAFAKWLTSGESPTVARSLVNRVWQAYFGTGIVATSEDLGVQCEPPSHAELLDWLAVEFMEKAAGALGTFHRLIANSATYRQASRVSAPLLARDPYNRLLAKRRRGSAVDDEVVPRHRTLGKRAARPQDRRPERVPAGPGVPVPAAGELRAQGLERGDGD